MDGLLSSDSDTDSIKPRGKTVKLKRKFKSGMDLKALEGVQMHLKWPHAFLQYQYVTQSLRYKFVLYFHLILIYSKNIITNL